jgi:hypothetical protein
MVRKSQIRKLLYLRKVRKSKKELSPQIADLQFAEFCGPRTFEESTL